MSEHQGILISKSWFRWRLEELDNFVHGLVRGHNYLEGVEKDYLLISWDRELEKLLKECEVLVK